MNLHQPDKMSLRRLLVVSMAIGLLAGCQRADEPVADAQLESNEPEAAIVQPAVQDAPQDGSQALSEELLAAPELPVEAPDSAGIDSALVKEPAVLVDQGEPASPVGEPAAEPGPVPPVEIAPEPVAEITPEPVAEPEAPALAPAGDTAPEPVVSTPVPAPEASSPRPETEPPVAIAEPVPPPVQTAPAAPAMDLEDLEAKLRKTKAIGVFTKLELKNQVEDLVKEMDAYHQHRGNLSLEQLEERFDLLVMKLLLLLQDDDPGLHQQIASARPALWTTLADPNQFATVRGT